jgi:hypothetical protein
MLYTRGEMLGRDLLIFPDTGEQFTRTLRTSALYASRVHSLTFVGIPDRNKRFGSLMREFRTKAKNLSVLQIHGLTRMEEYGAFTVGRGDGGQDTRFLSSDKLGTSIPGFFRIGA